MKISPIRLRAIMREEIALERKRAQKRPGAGHIIVKNFPDGYRVLALRVYGQYDIPKGEIEEGETAHQAAVRETAEEAGITQLRYAWQQDPIQIGHLTLWLAETTQEPEIRQNPETGIWEHHEAKWVTWEEMRARVPGFLKEAVDWAQSLTE